MSCNVSHMFVLYSPVPFVARARREHVRVIAERDAALVQGASLEKQIQHLPG